MLAAGCTWRRDNFLLSPGIGIGSLRVNAFVASLRRLDYAFVFSRSVRLVLIVVTRWVLTLRNSLFRSLGSIGRGCEDLFIVGGHDRERREHGSGYIERLQGTKPSGRGLLWGV